MKRKIIRKTLAFFLALALISSVLPMTVSARDEQWRNFTDTNFREYVYNTFDKDTDGTLSLAERLVVTKIDLYEAKVYPKSLAGIELFPNLQELTVSKTALGTVDLSQNTKLTKVFLSTCQLTALDVSKNTALKELTVAASPALTSLDVTKNTALTYLYCCDNALTALDVSHNPKLIKLYCTGNELTSLYLGNNPELDLMWCDDNKLTAVDVTGTRFAESGYYEYIGNQKDGITLRVTMTAEQIKDFAKSADSAKNVRIEYYQVARQFLFENDPAAEGWTFVDADGDGYTWFLGNDESFDEQDVLFRSHQGKNSLSSWSYLNGGTALDPDDWAISPAVTVPVGGQFSMYVLSQDRGYLENYTVYVSNTTDISKMTAISGKMTAPGSEANAAGSKAYTQVVFDVSAYAGKTVRFAIRHHDSKGKFVLDVDQIELFGACVDLPKTEGLYKVEGVWVYAKDGMIRYDYTGFAKHHESNTWFYVTDGKLDWNMSGAFKHPSGIWFIVKNGQIDWGFNGFYMANGLWFYFENGQINWNLTGLFKHPSGTWFYVKNAQIDWGYTGFGKHAASNTWFYCENGSIAWNKSGAFKHPSGAWFIVKAGQIDWSYTGLYKANGVWFYFRNGQLDFGFSGKVKYNGQWFNVKNGQVVF